MRIRTGIAVAMVALTGAACDLDLDVTNPNAATEEEVLTDLDGLYALSLGMQQQFASSILDYVLAPALVTDEWGTQTRALAADQSLFLGEGIDPGYGVVSAPYTITYRVVRSANNLIAAAPNLTEVGPGIQVGFTATAKLFKAMALGFTALHFERMAIDSDIAGAQIVSRDEGLAEVIRLLESARADLATVSDAQLAPYRTRAIPTGFDLRATVDAMLARYYLVTGQYQQANDAALRVAATATSVFNYSDPDFNPIWRYNTQLLYTAPLVSFVTEAEAGDMRPSFWVNTAAAPFNGNPPIPLLPPAFYSNRNAPFPVFLPGEMLLIRAEAQARLGNLGAARDLINQVRTKTGTATQPGAGLPALPTEELDTLNEVLAQIAYERRYELYNQGLRWEDIRRFGSAIAGEQLEVQFLPFPESECRTNPNAGC